MSFCSKLSTGFPSPSKKNLKSLHLLATLPLKVRSADQQHQPKPNSMGELLNQILQSTGSLRRYKCPSKFEKQTWRLLLACFLFSPFSLHFSHRGLVCLQFIRMPDSLLLQELYNLSFSQNKISLPQVPARPSPPSPSVFPKCCHLGKPSPDNPTLNCNPSSPQHTLYVPSERYFSL